MHGGVILLIPDIPDTRTSTVCDVIEMALECYRYVTYNFDTACT